MRGLETLPFIPYSVFGVCLVVTIAGLILAMRDQHARDGSWVQVFGGTLIMVGLLSFVAIGAWNMVIGIGAYTRHQQELAIIVPMDR